MNKEQELSNFIENDGNTVVFLVFPYTRDFVNSKAFLGIIFIDGTFCTDHCKSTLLAAVTVTPDRIILPLGVAETSGETLENYSIFLGELLKYIPDSTDLVFMADQHPSIKSSIGKIYPLSQLVPCAWHIAKHLRCPPSIFFNLLKSDNISLFNARWEIFQKKYPDSAQKILPFIDQIAYAKNNTIKLGFVSDSPIESFNASIKEYRSKEPLLLLIFIFQWSIAQRNKQLNLLSNDLFCKVARTKERIRKGEGEGLSIKEQKDGTFRVIEFFPGKIDINYLVKQENCGLVCDCGGYTRDGVPCRHEYEVAKRFALEYKLRNLAEFNETKRIMEGLGKPYNIPNFGNISETNIKLPEVNRQPGRPKILRARGANEFFFKKSKRRCSNCGNFGHDKRKCPRNRNGRTNPPEPSVEKVLDDSKEKAQWKKLTPR